MHKRIALLAVSILLQHFSHRLAATGQTVSTRSVDLGALNPTQDAPIRVPPAPRESGTPTAARDPNCLPLENRYVPLRNTIEARLTTFIDSAHVKPGKKIWVSSLFEDDDPECKMVKDAVIYGSVTVASSSKKPAASELGLQFDRVDCFGQKAKAMKLTVIAIVAPESWHGDTVHNSLPGQGGGVTGGYGWDQDLDPGGPPDFVRPGEVVGLKKLSLDPRGGPKCSDRLTGAEGKVQLDPGTVLILAPD